MRTPLVIHGHFYQPPRENPWSGVVDREPSAAPFHDWNERITDECYRANAFARVRDRYGHVERLANNYAKLSFNFGPTLLTWLERADPGTYRRVLDADRASVERNDGHGNAIAQAYNHAILPLCSDRDRRTQLRWGLADFRLRFGREAEALWLPETACDAATIGALIDEGLSYVILSPQQADSVRDDEEEWQSVADGTIDTSEAYVCLHPDGSARSIAAFFYDGPRSQAIAFEGVLVSSPLFLGRLRDGSGREGGLVHVATDGETYGHHSKGGAACLAYALEVDAQTHEFEVTNYGAFLAENPPKREVLLKRGPDGEGTAWSCAHGVGRWSRDCGCQDGGREGWNQAWRGPLRAALDLLRDELGRHFEAMSDTGDPWRARDAYVDLLHRGPEARDAWLAEHVPDATSDAGKARALTFLELERNVLFSYTSCGWFFADVSGLEAVQVLKYAGRALDLADELGLPSVRGRFLEQLAEATSNIAEFGNGADVFRRFVSPLREPMSEATVPAGLVDRVAELVQRFASDYERLYEESVELAERASEAGIELPKELRVAAELTLGRRFAAAVAAAGTSQELAAWSGARLVAEQARRLHVRIDTEDESRVFAGVVLIAVEHACHERTADATEHARALVEFGPSLGLQPDLRRAEEALFEAFGDATPWPSELRPLAVALGVSGHLFIVGGRRREDDVGDGDALT